MCLGHLRGHMALWNIKFGFYFLVPNTYSTAHDPMLKLVKFKVHKSVASTAISHPLLLPTANTCINNIRIPLHNKAVSLFWPRYASFVSQCFSKQGNYLILTRFLLETFSVSKGVTRPVGWSATTSRNTRNRSFTFRGSSRVRPCTKVANECIKRHVVKYHQHLMWS